jgi:hypothetical protein
MHLLKQNKTKQNKTKQNKTKQNKTKQNKTKQNKTKQNKTMSIKKRRSIANQKTRIWMKDGNNSKMQVGGGGLRKLYCILVNQKGVGWKSPVQEIQSTKDWSRIESNAL